MDTKIETPLSLLHKFFNGIRRSVRGDERGKRGTNESRKARRANAKLWAEGHNGRAKQIAVCPRCPTWFATVDARNAHRAANPGAHKAA